MKQLLLILTIGLSLSAAAQKEGDTLYNRCPVSVLDTTSGNNYFLAQQPAIIKTYRNRGNVAFRIEQKNQFFTVIFNVKRLKSKARYQVKTGEGARDEVGAKYSFTSGESVAYVDVSSGIAQVEYDKVTKLWHIQLTGYISNLGERGASYFKAKADFFVL